MTRTVVIAGVGEGLGSSVAEEFTQAGDDVALLARSQAYLTNLASDLSSENEGTAIPFPTDLANRSEVAETFESIREQLGPVDGLVFTAFGTDRNHGGILDTDGDALRGALDIRVHGLFECVSEAATDMREHDGGTVIVINSGTARTPSNSPVDTAARCACRGLTRSMAADSELGEHGIQSIHVVVDGWISKPSLREKFPDHDRWMEPDEVATVLGQLFDAPDTVHSSEIDLRHPRDDISF